MQPNFSVQVSNDGSRKPGIEVSLLDTRQFRVITLANQLQVLLVSDPTSSSAAASMDLGVGYFSDPPDLPGLAHFCKHMLFLVTEKYPDENGYGKFLTENSKSRNALTDWLSRKKAWMKRIS